MTVEVETVRTAEEYESHLRAYVYESGEEGRAVRVGEKEVSEQATIVRRYADLFTRKQLEALRLAEESEVDALGRERIHRLRKSCETGIVFAELAPFQDALVNAELEARVEFRGESLPLRTARARVGLLPGYADREELGRSSADVSATLNDRRLELLIAAETLGAELSGTLDPVAREDEEKGISIRRLADVLSEATAAVAESYEDMRQRWLDRLLGPDRESRPASYHAAYVHRLSPLAHVYAKDRATTVCVETLNDIGLELIGHPTIRTDLDDRPQKTPRPCIVASDPPAVVHLITRALGGLQDYQGLLHEAGHAFHFAGCDPSLPYAFRALSRDNALTEIYAFVCESITRERGWLSRYFALSEEETSEHFEAVRFLYGFIVRRYAAKLEFELEFWSRFAGDGGTPGGYTERLTEATGFVHRPSSYLADMDAGFYSADYLRGFVRAAQLRSYLVENVGEDWWCHAETGRFLSELFEEGTKPSNEEIAGRLGFDPLDAGPLIAELSTSR
jgi:hypothetical protein